MGEKLDKAIRRDDEDKTPKGCPKCGAIPFANRCVSCGFEIQKPALVEHMPGEMQEVMIGKKKLADDKRHLWEQMVSYARGHSAPEKQQGRASHLFKDITGDWPNRSWTIETTPDVAITRNVMNMIKSKNIAFSRGRSNGLR